MGDAAGRADRLKVEALLEFLEPFPKAFPACKNDGHDRDVHVVDQVGREELANCGRSSANPDVQTASRLPGGLQGLGGAGVDEVERCTALHLHPGPWMGGGDEHRGMEGRVVAPPALPLLVGPRAALRPKLVSSHDLGPDARAPVAGEGVVRAGAASWLALHHVEAPRREEPFMEPGTSVSEGCFEALAVTGAEPVERNREVVDSNA